jgi:Prolipoprotein diacylglyceryl transferase
MTNPRNKEPHCGNRRSIPPFRICGLGGLLVACALTTSLVIYRGLSVWVMLAIASIAVSIFLALVMATKIVVGYEIIIYYHHEIAVVAGTVLFLRFLHQPLLSYLDITVLGIGLFLACGRIGCLLVGCCHGRPFRWGFRYGEGHADAGFMPYYVGIPLFPVQAVESLWVLGIVVAGTSMVIRGDAPGSALTLYIVMYGLGRFCFEFLRGDPGRPYFWTFSEAQWTSIILMSAVVYGEGIHVLPLDPLDVAMMVLVFATMVGVAVRRHLRRTPTHLLLHPRHVREIAEALGFVVTSPARRTDDVSREIWPVHIGITSLGVQISGGVIPGAESCLSHYALSCSDRTMTPDHARTIAKLICLLRHSNCHVEPVQGNSGVFHLLVFTERFNGSLQPPLYSPTAQSTAQ